MLGGADLFLQGFITPREGLGEISTGELRSVCIPGNPFPFAVGHMEVDSATIKKMGMKGRGLKLLHNFPDCLWALGDKSLPSKSFTATRIFPLVRILHPASELELRVLKVRLQCCCEKQARRTSAWLVAGPSGCQR